MDSADSPRRTGTAGRESNGLHGNKEGKRDVDDQVGKLTALSIGGR